MKSFLDMTYEEYFAARLKDLSCREHDKPEITCQSCMADLVTKLEADIKQDWKQLWHDWIHSR